MKRLILIFFIVSVITSFGKNYPKHEFGVEFSSMSSYGFAYQIELNNIIAVKTNFMAYYTSDNPPDDLNLYATLGLSLQYNLKKSEFSRPYFFLSYSNLYFQEKSIETKFLNDKKIVTRFNQIDRINNFSAGLGYEYKLLDMLSLSAELGLQYQISDNSKLSELFDRNPSGTSFIGLGIGISLRYSFNNP